MQEKKHYIIGGRKWLQQEITLEQSDALIDLIFELEIFTEDKIEKMIAGKFSEVIDIVDELRKKRVLNKALAIMLIQCPKTIKERLWAFIRWILRIDPVGFQKTTIEAHSVFLGKAPISLAGVILTDFFTCNAVWVKNIAKSLGMMEIVPQSKEKQPRGPRE